MAAAVQGCKVDRMIGGVLLQGGPQPSRKTRQPGLCAQPSLLPRHFVCRFSMSLLRQCMQICAGTQACNPQRSLSHTSRRSAQANATIGTSMQRSACLLHQLQPKPLLCHCCALPCAAPHHQRHNCPQSQRAHRIDHLQRLCGSDTNVRSLLTGCSVLKPQTCADGRKSTQKRSPGPNLHAQLSGQCRMHLTMPVRQCHSQVYIHSACGATLASSRTHASIRRLLWHHAGCLLLLYITVMQCMSSLHGVPASGPSSGRLQRHCRALSSAHSSTPARQIAAAVPCTIG